MAQIANPFGSRPAQAATVVARVSSEQQAHAVDEFAGLLREQVELLRSIDRRLAVLAAEPACALADTDVRILEAALPILGEGLGPDGRGFTSAEALAYLAQHHCDLAISVKRFGKLLARCVDVPIAGFRVCKDGRLQGSVAWRVWRV